MKISINAAFLLVIGLTMTASSSEHEEEEKGNPEFLVDAPNTTNEEKINDELTSDDILFTSVDHLPAEMPKEASNHFGSKLLPFVEAVVKSDFSKPFAE